MKIISSLLFSLLLLTSFTASAQHFLRTSGTAIVNENNDTILLRGMGLGGWMLQEGYMLQTASFANAQYKIREKISDLIGPTNTQTFYDAWLANHVTKNDIDSLKSWGFNSVRLPMHYNLFTLPIEDEPIAGQNTWLTTGFELTDSLISWCAQNEMYVILDLHAAPGGQGYDEGISDYDPSKPSLWESADNRDKMVALWKRLAERYVNEQWIAGYDILNEPNWDLPGGTALRALYDEVTDSIRAVDTTHIIFIEGNWFANDFTGLTPPWDDNMVYSPHKYWSVNDQGSIQGWLNMRSSYNIPLYLGESGENSNVWFRDAIRLLEDLDIGWAWWPMKKIESIAGPLSVLKTPEYQTLLDYWSTGGTAPTSTFATNALMEIANDLKIENCVYQKDVIDAMFRQVYSDETIPYAETLQIPGVIYATDFDLGVIGEAYYDNESGNYQVSTGVFTSWNNGWVYRNDGVDIEFCADTINTNGYNVGWLDTDEWMKYSVDVTSAAVYDLHIRSASGASGGNIQFRVGNSVITPSVTLPATGDWQNWVSTTIPNIILDELDTDITLYVGQEGFNMSSFEFIETGTPASSIATEFMAAVTIDESSIQMNTNKYMLEPLPTSPADFEVFADGNAVPINSMTVDPDNKRIIVFDLAYTLKSSEEIKISYSGNQVLATDSTQLAMFTLKDVENNLTFVHQIPTRIEAEAFTFQAGVSLETTTDIGGGQNIGFLDPGDYLDYEVNIAASGTYVVQYRTASESATGELDLQLIDTGGIVTTVNSPVFAPTGGWQTWATTTESVFMPAGRYIMRVVIVQAPFNVNWINFASFTHSPDYPVKALKDIVIFPNPIDNYINVRMELNSSEDFELMLFNANGTLVLSKSIQNTTMVNEKLLLADYPDGIYFLKLVFNNGSASFGSKLVKVGR